MIRRTYKLIMDDERNPFNGLPKVVRFRFMLILSYMWSAVFSIWIGSMFLHIYVWIIFLDLHVFCFCSTAVSC